MNRRSAWIVRVLMGLVFVAGVCYACWPYYSDPVARLVQSEFLVGCGDAVHLDGVGVESADTGSYDEDDDPSPPQGGGNGIEHYSWSPPYGEFTEDGAGHATIRVWIPGPHNFTLTVTDGEEETDMTVGELTVVEIGDVIEGSAAADNVIVSVGSSVEFFALPNGASLWPPGRPNWTLWQPSGGVATYTENPTGSIIVSNLIVAGAYYAQATCGDYDDGDGGLIVAVEVASLTPDVGTEFDDGDGNENTNSYSVCVANEGVVHVTATPYPNVEEDHLPGDWSLEGGQTSGELVSAVDRTTPGLTTIECDCGVSSKTTKIYVVEVDKVVK